MLLSFYIVCACMLVVNGGIMKRSDGNAPTLPRSQQSDYSTNTHKKDIDASNNETNLPSNDGGNTSDYILIGMIVAMMLCMAVCCVCLFCRSSSHFSICGFNFEVSDRTQSVAIDDVSELHEVVPLTPTTVGSYNIPDIESKLRSDPPPPKYSEVAGSNMLDRFKWKSKKRVSGSEEKTRQDSIISNRPGETLISLKNKRSDKRNRSSRVSFQRSVSYQSSRTYKPNTSNTMPKFISTEDEGKQQKRSGFFSLRRSHSALQHSASDCTFNSRPARILEEVVVTDSSQNIKEDESIKEHINVTVPLKDKNTNSESLPPCKDSSTELYDDDEVFM